VVFSSTVELVISNCQNSHYRRPCNATTRTPCFPHTDATTIEFVYLSLVFGAFFTRVLCIPIAFPQSCERSLPPFAMHGRPPSYSKQAGVASSPRHAISGLLQTEGTHDYIQGCANRPQRFPDSVNALVTNNPGAISSQART
jgi:hypothetical protein